jgi:predicted O-methyltransferase YrrM
MHPIDQSTRISPEQGAWMYEAALALKPRSILEVGMAYGYSSLFFLASLERSGTGGKLTSIDPFQHHQWKGVGVTHALSMPTAGSFRLVEERSDRGVMDLLREGERFDMIFIDGNHRFDDVLVDFYLCDQICAIGGHIILDDMWMSSIKSVASFIRTNRDDYAEVSTGVGNTAMFKKLKVDDRPWTNFTAFTVAS